MYLFAFILGMVLASLEVPLYMGALFVLAMVVIGVYHDTLMGKYYPLRCKWYGLPRRLYRWLWSTTR